MEWFICLLLLVTAARGQGTFDCSFEDGSCGWIQSTDDDVDWVRTQGDVAEGPLFDYNVGGSTGFYYYIDDFGGTSSGKSAILVSPDVITNGNGIGWCVSFWFNSYPKREMGSIDVYAYPSTESVGTQTPIASIQGHQTGRRAWLQTMTEIPNQSTNFTVALAANQQPLSSDVYAIDDVSITQGDCHVNLTFDCDFEAGFCGWSQSLDDNSNWVIERGSTAHSNTGPMFDHTIGTIDGKYIYLHGISSGDKAVLLSLDVVTRFSQSRVVSFWYNMFGGAVGT
ncbi:MAM and LDL-receptor class A domain-containing protein 1-like [Asterias rubens]|uniref:MAM and LDL-receptor class A domain-containing protein 1-like n=1 Tax=Asterias rubens TaxID=7604 RepID=UPI001455B905|nr:MAM and LDL-receptor class A domain-containing protein 1-like [Asterias rubens]